jgi:succinate-semialdehyde dehydrogenase/glutarate-semialdehyde dehydrogenase
MKSAQDIAGAQSPVRLQQFIAGRWVHSSSNRFFAVHNPATGAVLAWAPDSNRTDARQAIDAAAQAFPTWSRLPAPARALILHRIGDLMLERREPLARLAALEEGKPIAEARGEIRYAADFFHFFAEEGKRINGEIIPTHLPNKRLSTVKQPVGVAGIIPIWNFPAAGIARPGAAALAAGCTLVIKPAEQTPLSAIALFELFEEAELPAGAANLVSTLHPQEIGEEFVQNRQVKKLNFTGSLEVGRQLMRAAADQVKRITLELGGHAPLIVFEDADLEAAARGAVLSKFRNNGQICVALNRIYVHESILEPFSRRLVELTQCLKLGNPLDENVNLGPLIDEEGYQKVNRHVTDALAKGARLLLGGRRRTDGELAKGFFFEPTILTDVRPGMQILEEETFGPVAPIAAFSTEEEVLARANELPYGLAAFFYTRDLARSVRVAERLEYGIVGINDSLPGAAHVPFGGQKQSGIGKEGGRMGLEEFLDTKFLSLGL